MADKTFRLRPMTADDIPAATRLWQATEGIGLTASDEPAALTVYLERNPGLSSIAVDAAGELCGVVLCGHDGARGYIRHLAVARRARRQGIARALVARCTDSLKALRIHKCSIHIFTDNEIGLRIWDQLGWRVREDLTVMQVVLTGARADQS